ncbi:Protein Ves [Ephemeroptericola cinctiostellae]|uniref:Protein Ves n=1 Tax=Ephemeroptericola cinctiostellae TaxID=2268024 RepID=A0A345DCP9_9BURK|nr:HutD family protein [Ephemeroptericola cinctiostellae]AXF86137.1 Protein Ves [Ephemeroptericola cinctiostellae]
MMQKITPDDHRIMPWRNGQGSTTELLVEPAGAGLDDFDWRISCATVQADGDFSIFPEVDRSLLIMSGAGMNLNFNQQVTLTLTPESQVLNFVGEDHVHAGLLNGAITDFNVMTRRGRWLHVLETHTFDRALNLHTQSDLLLIYHADGDVIECMTDDANVFLARHELLRIESSGSELADVESGRIALKSEGRATVYAVHLKRRT